MVQAIFFDIDGTLISDKIKKCTESTIIALDKLHNKGVYLFISTGRHILEIEKEHLLDGIYFDGYITLNGQYCFNKNEIIYQNEINKDDVKNIIDQIDTVHYPCMFVEKDRMYINMINQKVIDVQKSIYSSLPPVMDIHCALKNSIYQMVPYLDQEQAEIYPLSVLKYSKATRWNAYAMDIVPDSGSKKEGIKRILEYYKIPLEDTMAFGDGENDIEMLEYAAVGIAMGNAEERVKKAADYITDNVENSGIIHALEKYKLI